MERVFHYNNSGKGTSLIGRHLPRRGRSCCRRAARRAFARPIRFRRQNCGGDSSLDTHQENPVLDNRSRGPYVTSPLSGPEIPPVQRWVGRRTNRSFSARPGSSYVRSFPTWKNVWEIWQRFAVNGRANPGPTSPCEQVSRPTYLPSGNVFLGVIPPSTLSRSGEFRRILPGESNPESSVFDRTDRSPIHPRPKCLHVL